MSLGNSLQCADKLLPVWIAVSEPARRLEDRGEDGVPLQGAIFENLYWKLSMMNRSLNRSLAIGIGVLAAGVLSGTSAQFSCTLALWSSFPLLCCGHRCRRLHIQDRSRLHPGDLVHDRRALWTAHQRYARGRLGGYDLGSCLLERSSRAFGVTRCPDL